MDEKTVNEVRDVLEDFISDLTNRLSTQRAEGVLQGHIDDLSSADLGQKPETYTENKLVYPLLGAVGIEFDRQPHGQSGDQTTWPDFGSTNLDEYVIGENKPLNNVSKGEKELKQYLDSISIGADFGILTDGFSWCVFTAERSGDRTEFPEVRSVDLRTLILSIARENGFVASSSITDVDVSESIADFVEQFGRDSFNEYIVTEVPQYLKNLRKRDIDEFYDLYIELLFGEGDDYSYDTHLMNEIDAPRGASDTDRRRFAVTLMNRLLFIKILEAKGVVTEGLLQSRVDAYNENPGASMEGLYGSQFRPLFYKLFNTPREDRKGGLRRGWATEVPYLNGGLFRKNVDDEDRYSVGEEILEDIVTDLIEGSVIGEEDDGAIDPAILGAVFEKTINYMGGEFGTQKNIGAYYTPEDVTSIITEQAVDARIRDELIETWVEATDAAENIVREYIEELTLTEIAEKVEIGSETAIQTDNGHVRIRFGDEDAIEEAIDRLESLTVVDPSCGSGHFLTSVMEQMHRVRKSLERGLNDGDEMAGADNYQIKKNLALNNVYGVDVDPVAIEIARLRVWLKIIEDGWEEDYGRLPNIELNIVSGNSLVGLPTEVQGQTRTDVWDDDIENLIDLRLDYKQRDDVPKEEVLEKRKEIRESLNEQFIRRLTYDVKTEVGSVAEWLSIADSVEETLHPEVSSIQIKREDEEALEQSTLDRLNDAGFRTHKKSARLWVENHYETRKSGNTVPSNAEIKEEIVDTVASLMEDGLVISEIERRPVKSDLDRALGTPAHWIAEFPELAENKEIGFDIIVGNPPYGDILDDNEKALVGGYMTGGTNEVAAQFVERQLDLLNEDGYFGNITTLRLVYQSTIQEIHETLRNNLRTAQVACFAKRPDHIFENAQVRAAIISGKKNTKEEGDIVTSEFIRFSPEDRSQRLSNVDYHPVDGFLLGDTIGDPTDTYSILPKVGNETIASILNKLKQQSDTTFIDIIDRKNPSDFEVWRMRHPDNWVNPMMREMYDAQDLEPMFFDTELERDAAFLIMSSSTFYLYWMVYGNQRDLNWGQVEAYPWPDHEDLEGKQEEIHELADRLWEGMEDTFTTDPNPHYHNMSGLKPLIHRADDIFGPMYGLTEEEIEYIQSYDSDYGRTGSDNRRLDDFSD